MPELPFSREPPLMPELPATLPGNSSQHNFGLFALY
jgi:hypothetical protein